MRMATPLKKCVVLISGSGTNLQALIDAVAEGRLPLDIELVVSNKKNAYGLTRAQKAGIPTLYFPLNAYTKEGKSRTEYDEDLAQEIKKRTQPDVIVLAGWMHIVSPQFLDQFKDIVINLHPAKPGEFDGTQSIARAYNAFQEGNIKSTGVMVHMVTPEVDQGRVLKVQEVPILPEDTLEDLEHRMHATEHVILVDSIREFVEML
eukprot:CFRG2766T1